MVAGELEGVAALDEAEALVDEALELDRLDLGAVLFGLSAALRLLVGIELALDRRSGRSSSRRVPDTMALKASTMASSCACTASASGIGRGSGSPSPGRWP
jgi:hypothetical protein